MIVEEPTAAEVAEELHEIMVELNGMLRALVDHFDPPLPRPRERHLRLVGDAEGA